MTAVSLLSVAGRARAAGPLGFAIALAALGLSSAEVRAASRPDADQPDDGLPGPESALRDAAGIRVLGES